mmetsp:Transcript_41161/g.113490  ORF Transcript_41161/g.113490 Transcript_41161/m.113490 type:complete len:223 (+) Transcript_41161:931-1599(+)
MATPAPSAQLPNSGDREGPVLAVLAAPFADEVERLRFRSFSAGPPTVWLFCVVREPPQASALAGTFIPATTLFRRWRSITLVTIPAQPSMTSTQLTMAIAWLVLAAPRPASVLAPSAPPGVHAPWAAAKIPATALSMHNCCHQARAVESPHRSGSHSTCLATRPMTAQLASPQVSPVKFVATHDATVPPRPWRLTPATMVYQHGDDSLFLASTTRGGGRVVG